MISIIVLNWNTSDILIRMYDSIKKNSILFNEIIVLDNGSKKEEYEKIKHFENLIRLEKNVGFAAGNNEACKIVKSSDFVVFINSDIIVEEHGWDDKFYENFKEVMDEPDVGIIGCAYHPLKWDRNGNFHIQPIPDHPVESESVQGAFFAIKGSLFKELMKNDGCIFDESFKYAQYEETDLCFRIRKMGYKVLWVPIKHIHDYRNSATIKNSYKLNSEIQNMNDFKRNSESNKKLFLEKHWDIL